MKKLSIKIIQYLFFKNFKTIFLNKTINLNYILIKKNEIKNCYFNGICICINKNKSLILINKLKKEIITLYFNITSPLISKINIFFIIRKKKKLSKLFYLKKLL